MRQVRYVMLLAFLIWCSLAPGYCGEDGMCAKGVNCATTVHICTDWNYQSIYARVQPLCAIALAILAAAYLNRHNKKVFLISAWLSFAVILLALVEPPLFIYVEEYRNNGSGSLRSVPFGFFAGLLLICLLLVLFAAKQRVLARFLAICSGMLSIGGLLLPQLASYVLLGGTLIEHFVGMQ